MIFLLKPPFVVRDFPAMFDDTGGGSLRRASACTNGVHKGCRAIAVGGVGLAVPIDLVVPGSFCSVAGPAGVVGHLHSVEMRRTMERWQEAMCQDFRCLSLPFQYVSLDLWHHVYVLVINYRYLLQTWMIIMMWWSPTFFKSLDWQAVGCREPA